MNDTVTLEQFMLQYASAPPDTKQAMLDAGMMRVQSSVEHTDDEPYLTLTELTPKLGYRSYSSLWRLGIKAAADDFGGRPRYRLSRALAYLKSSECESRRNEIREARYEQKGRGT